MSSEGDRLRVGVIGTGAISQIVHVPVFAEREDVELVAMADIDPHKAETLSRRFQVPLVMEAEDLIDFEGVDAIVVSTPNRYHEPQAIAALEAGKHVLVERPVAVTAEGAQRVVDTAERTGKTLSVGMAHRFRPGVVALRDFVAGGDLGRVYAVRGSWMTRPTPMLQTGWRRDAEISGGGALMDLGLAALDLCMWVLGYPEIKRISCVTGARDDVDVEESATLMAETTEGAALTLEVSNHFFAAEDRFRARVLGDEGSAWLPPLKVFKQVGGRPMEVTPRQPRPQGGEHPYTNAYRRLLDDFVRRVAGLADAELPTEQPKLMALIQAAYRAAHSGREVEL
jgi:predicted dehydrogenase